MTLDIFLVCAIVVIALVLFATEKVRVDLVAISIMVALMIIGLFRPGLLSVEEGISGFSNTATITIGAMLVLSAGLFRTGIVGAASARLMRIAGDSETRVFVVVLVTVGVVSAFINNTAAVAVFLPISLTICKRIGLSPSKILIPISFASIVGGTCTLIGTSTNILVSSMAEDRGLAGFSMFEFSKLGGIYLLVGLPYLIYVARHLLPHREGEKTLTGKYRLDGYLTAVEIARGSDFIGQTLTQARVGERYQVAVLEVRRGGDQRWSAIYDTELKEADILIVQGGVEDILELTAAEGLKILSREKFADRDLTNEDTMIAEAIIAPSSSLVGRTMKEANFRHVYDVFAMAIRQHGEALRERIGDIRLQVGDTLLLQGKRESLARLTDSPDFLTLQEIDLPRLRTEKGIYAVSILGFVVVTASIGLMPILVSSLIGCVLMIATRCLTMKEAYDSIDWFVIFLLAGVIPLGIAMENSGTAELISSGLLHATAPLGLIGLISAFYLLSTVFASIMSHHAAVVLLVPIGIATANELGVSPVTFLMAIAFSASSSMSTPFGYHTNLMIYGPGGYRFGDYLKAGIPLNIIFWILATVLIPILWPFTAV